MKMATVILQHKTKKRNGKPRRKIVNEFDYARDLGKSLYRDYERVGAESGDGAEIIVDDKGNETVIKEADIQAEHSQAKNRKEHEDAKAMEPARKAAAQRKAAQQTVQVKDKEA